MSSGNTQTQRELIAKLAELAELAEQYRASLYLIEQQRLSLTARLRQSGWCPPPPDPQGQLL